MSSLICVRGRVSSRTELAWLEVDGTWRFAGDPHFEIAVPDGPPVRVTTEPSTDWPRSSRRSKAVGARAGVLREHPETLRRARI